MSKTFGIHVAMHDDAGALCQWVPGDPVPDWVASRIGDHCFADAVEPDAVSDEPFMRPADDPAEPEPESAATAAPDFTGAAKPARGRPRKS